MFHLDDRVPTSLDHIFTFQHLMRLWATVNKTLVIKKKKI